MADTAAACPGETGGPPDARAASDAAPSLASWKLTRHKELDSTNAEAQRLLAAGFSGKRVILADRQSAGRGRGGRVWESDGPYGLWASLMLTSLRPPDQLAQAALALGVAVREAVAGCAGVPLEIKWPNDLLAGDRKCCGLLVETGPLPSLAEESAPGETARPVPLILGVGLNLNQTEDRFSAALRGRATSLRLLSGRRHRRLRVLSAILTRVDHWFGLWERSGFAPVREAWLRNTRTVGRTVLLPEGYGASQGIAVDLADDGALLVRTRTQALLRVTAGDILFSSPRTVCTPAGGGRRAQRPETPCEADGAAVFAVPRGSVSGPRSPTRTS